MVQYGSVAQPPAASPEALDASQENAMARRLAAGHLLFRVADRRSYRRAVQRTPNSRSSSRIAAS